MIAEVLKNHFNPAVYLLCKTVKWERPFAKQYYPIGLTLTYF